MKRRYPERVAIVGQVGWAGRMAGAPREEQITSARGLGHAGVDLHVPVSRSS